MPPQKAAWIESKQAEAVTVADLPAALMKAGERSRALHLAVAEKIKVDLTIVAAARARTAKWLDDGTTAKPYAEAWLQLLDTPLEEIVMKLAEQSDEMHEMRQVSPFAGVLDPRTRWRIHREVGAKFADEALPT